MVVIHDLNLALRFCDCFLLLQDGFVYRYGGQDIIDRKAMRDVYGIEGEVTDVKGRKVIIVD